jgi:hypothetical protein
MRAMVVEVGFEVQQLVFKIGGCPEQGTIQALSADGTDQPLHKGMGRRNVGHGLDFGHIQDSQVGLPLMRFSSLARNDSSSETLTSNLLSLPASPFVFRICDNGAIDFRKKSRIRPMRR